MNNFSSSTPEARILHPDSDTLSTQPAPTESSAPNPPKSALKMSSGSAAEDPRKVTFITPSELDSKVATANRWLKAQLLEQ